MSGKSRSQELRCSIRLIEVKGILSYILHGAVGLGGCFGYPLAGRERC